MPAAIGGLPPGLLAQARALGAGRGQLSLLALGEARIGVFAAVIALWLRTPTAAVLVGLGALAGGALAVRAARRGIIAAPTCPVPSTGRPDEEALVSGIGRRTG